MSTQHKPSGAWFFDADNPEEGQDSAESVLHYEGEHVIREVVGAREVWRGYGFLYTDEHGDEESAWFATKGEAEEALAEIKRKQADEE